MTEARAFGMGQYSHNNQPVYSSISLLCFALLCSFSLFSALLFSVFSHFVSLLCSSLLFFSLCLSSLLCSALFLSPLLFSALFLTVSLFSSLLFFSLCLSSPLFFSLCLTSLPFFYLLCHARAHPLQLSYPIALLVNRALTTTLPLSYALLCCRRCTTYCTYSPCWEIGLQPRLQCARCWTEDTAQISMQVDILPTPS